MSEIRKRNNQSVFFSIFLKFIKRPAASVPKMFGDAMFNILALFDRAAKYNRAQIFRINNADSETSCGQGKVRFEKAQNSNTTNRKGKKEGQTCQTLKLV